MTPPERRRPLDHEFEMPSLRLDGRAALVTGGGRGLGLGMALAVPVLVAVISGSLATAFWDTVIYPVTRFSHLMEVSFWDAIRGHPSLKIPFSEVLTLSSNAVSRMRSGALDSKKNTTCDSMISSTFSKPSADSIITIRNTSSSAQSKYSSPYIKHPCGPADRPPRGG